MNRNDASRKIGATVTVIAAIAGCAAYTNAQATVSMQEVAPARMMTVSTSAPGSRSDDAIIVDVRRAIRRVPDMKDSAIRIRVHRGVVTLTGSVPESWQISRAGNAARSVRGVRGVSNRLTERKKDVAAIEQRVAPSAG